MGRPCVSLYSANNLISLIVWQSLTIHSMASAFSSRELHLKGYEGECIEV